MDAPWVRSSAIVVAATCSTAESPLCSTRDDLADLLDDAGEHRATPLSGQPADRPTILRSSPSRVDLDSISSVTASPMDSDAGMAKSRGHRHPAASARGRRRPRPRSALRRTHRPGSARPRAGHVAHPGRTAPSRRTAAPRCRGRAISALASSTRASLRHAVPPVEHDAQRLVLVRDAVRRPARSAAGRRRARCRCRPRSRRRWRAARARRRARPAAVIHCELRSAAATRPSRVAAYFQVTNGRPVRTACSHGSQRPPAAASSAQSPATTSTPACSRTAGAAGSFGVGIGDGVDDASDAGGDQRVGARAGAAGVRARFEGDHHGARRAPRHPPRRGPRSRRAARRLALVAPSPTRVAVRARARPRRPAGSGWCGRARSRPSTSARRIAASSASSRSMSVSSVLVSDSSPRGPLARRAATARSGSSAP